MISEAFKKSEDLFFPVNKIHCIKVLFNYIILPEGVAVAANIFNISDN